MMHTESPIVSGGSWITGAAAGALAESSGIGSPSGPTSRNFLRKTLTTVDGSSSSCTL